MTNILTLGNYGIAKFVAAGTPGASIIGAQLNDVYCNSDDGMLFNCTAAIVGSQVWLGTDGIEYGVGVGIASPLHPDLVAMYTMDNISGATLVDESLNGNDGTITGASVVAGHIGNGLDFVDNPNGTANAVDYVDLPLITIVGDFSLCFWVDINTTRKARGVFMGYGEPVSAGGEHGFFGYYDDSQYLRVSYFESGSTRSYNSPSLNVPDGFRFFGIIRSGAFFKLYIDSVLIHTWASGSEDLRINALGTFRTPNNRPDGPTSSVHSRWVYDTTRIFNRELIQNEMNTLWNSGVGV